MTTDCALYRHFAADQTLLYVGISDDPFRRASQHRCVEWSEQIAHMTVEWHPTRKSAEDAEKIAIATERPLHNKRHLPSEQPCFPTMTAADFIALHQRLGISRTALCRRIGIAPNTGTAYALGRKPIPITVALAAAAFNHGLAPYGESP